MSTNIAMATLGLFGGSGSGTGGTLVNIELAKQLNVNTATSININQIPVPLELARVNVVNLDTAVCRVANQMQVIRVESHEFNC